MSNAAARAERVASRAAVKAAGEPIEIQAWAGGVNTRGTPDATRGTQQLRAIWIMEGDTEKADRQFDPTNRREPRVGFPASAFALIRIADLRFAIKGGDRLLRNIDGNIYEVWKIIPNGVGELRACVKLLGSRDQTALR
jgi:hypothetical protein